MLWTNELWTLLYVFFSRNMTYFSWVHTWEQNYWVVAWMILSYSFLKCLDQFILSSSVYLSLCFCVFLPWSLCHSLWLFVSLFLCISVSPSFSVVPKWVHNFPPFSTLNKFWLFIGNGERRRRVLCVRKQCAALVQTCFFSPTGHNHPPWFPWPWWDLCSSWELRNVQGWLPQTPLYHLFQPMTVIQAQRPARAPTTGSWSSWCPFGSLVTDFRVTSHQGQW